MMGCSSLVLSAGSNDGHEQQTLQWIKSRTLLPKTYLHAVYQLAFFLHLYREMQRTTESVLLTKAGSI
jgi:hypothetical protein